MAVRIRTAFFGNGFTRSVILPCLRHVDAIDPVGISSPNLDRARETARRFAIPHVATEHGEILRRCEPELVFVVTPPHRHKEMAIDALRAGCHVVCEKPTALDAGESLAMLHAARAAPDRLALIDHELRFHPARIALAELIRTGDLGMILNATYALHSPTRRNPKLPWSWWSDAAQGGGALGAIGSHAIDAMRVLFGEITEARGRLRTLIRERTDPASGAARGVTSDDAADAWLRFESGAEAALAISLVEGGRLHRLQIAGSEGTALLDEQAPLRIGTDGGSSRSIEPDWGLPSAEDLEIPDTDWARSFLLFARRIVQAIEVGESSVPGAATFADGHRTQVVLDAIRVSSAGESWIPVARAAEPKEQKEGKTG